MNPDLSGIQNAFEYLKKMWPEFIGGGVAYWTHHFFHKIWNFPALLRRKPPTH